MNSKRIKKIAVALRLSYSSHRDVLYGISNFAKEHHWSVQIIPIPELFDANQLLMLEREGFEGFITSDLGDKDTFDFFERSTTPLVLTGPQYPSFARRSKAIAFVHIDDEAIGSCGAEYLHSLGRFRTIGFLPSHVKNHCSLLRQKGFAAAAKRLGLETVNFNTAKNVDGTEEDIVAIRSWVERIPKPAAIMTVHDFRATNLFEAIRPSKIKIPSNLAILSVDNDELICDFTDPPLSSIAPDYIDLGNLAARTLHKLMRGATAISVMSTKWRIMERESTAHIAPAAQIVNRALDYINKHATSGISASDVASHLKVSRRLADLRFRNATGMSMLEKIISLRLSAVKTKLKISHAPIKTITAACGFQSENYAKNLFKRRFNMSMREFRAHYNKTKKS